MSGQPGVADSGSLPVSSVQVFRETSLRPFLRIDELAKGFSWRHRDAQRSIEHLVGAGQLGFIGVASPVDRAASTARVRQPWKWRIA